MLEAVLSDIHYPDHDVAAHDLMLEILGEIQPDIITLLGDIVDEDPVSRYPTKPEYVNSLQDEFNVAHDNLGIIRQTCPKSKIYFQPGNHCVRAGLYLQSKAPELACLSALLLQSLLKLNDLDIEFIEEDAKWKIGDLYHTHGHLLNVGGSVNIARNIYLKTGVNMIVGHWHKHDMYTFTRYNNKSYIVLVNGTLQQKSPSFSHHNSWTQGFTLIDYSQNGRFKPEPIIFFEEDGFICYVLNGKLLKKKIIGSSKTPNKVEINIDPYNINKPLRHSNGRFAKR